MRCGNLRSRDAPPQFHPRAAPTVPVRFYCCHCPRRAAEWTHEEDNAVDRTAAHIIALGADEPITISKSGTESMAVLLPRSRAAQGFRDRRGALCGILRFGNLAARGLSVCARCVRARNRGKTRHGAHAVGLQVWLQVWRLRVHRRRGERGLRIPWSRPGMHSGITRASEGNSGCPPPRANTRQVTGFPRAVAQRQAQCSARSEKASAGVDRPQMEG